VDGGPAAADDDRDGQRRPAPYFNPSYSSHGRDSLADVA